MWMFYFCMSVSNLFITIVRQLLYQTLSMLKADISKCYFIVLKPCIIADFKQIFFTGYINIHTDLS